MFETFGIIIPLREREKSIAMRRGIGLSMAAALTGLTALTVLVAGSNSPHAQNTGPSEDARQLSTPPKAKKFPIGTEFEIARELFGEPKSRHTARVILKFMILSISDREIDRARDFMKKNRWEPDFLREYEKTVAWKDKVLRTPPEKIMDMAIGYYKEIADAPERRPLLVILMNSLFDKADKLGYKRAVFVQAQLYFLDEKVGPKDRGLDLLIQSAKDDFADSQLDLALRYLEGHDVPKDIRKAYYWLLQARKHMEIGSPFIRIQKILPAAELAKIEEYASRDHIWGPRD